MTTAERLRNMLQRHKDLRATVKDAMAEMERGRPHVAKSMLRAALWHDRRKAK